MSEIPTPAPEQPGDQTNTPTPSDSENLPGVAKRLAQFKQKGEAQSAVTEAEKILGIPSSSSSHQEQIPELGMDEEQKQALAQFLNQQPKTDEERAVAEAGRVLREPKGYEEVSHQRLVLERQLVEEYEKGISNPGTLLAFLKANRDYALTSQRREDWGDNSRQELITLAQRCQEALEGGQEERAAYCSGEASTAFKIVQSYLARSDDFYKNIRQGWLSSGMSFSYPEGYEGKKFEEQSEEEWIINQRRQDREIASDWLKSAALWSNWAIKSMTMPAIPYREDEGESKTNTTMPQNSEDLQGVAHRMQEWKKMQSQNGEQGTTQQQPPTQEK